MLVCNKLRSRHLSLELGQQVTHSEHVDIARIGACFSRCREFRYWLKIPYKRTCRRCEVVSVILKNPSSADTCMADRTVRKVEEYIHRAFPSAAILTVLNLFAYRATKPKCVDKRVRHGLQCAVGNVNDGAIRFWLQESDHIVVAWGAASGIVRSGYDERVRQVAEILYPYRGKVWRVGELSEQEHPLHGLRWKYKHDTLPKKRLSCGWKWWPSTNPDGIRSTR